MSDIPTGDGFAIDPEGVNLTLRNLGDGEKKLFDLIDSIRTNVIIAGFEVWEDPYGDKLLGTIDKLTNDLADILENVKDNDVKLRITANSLLEGTESTLRYPEVPSIDLLG